MQNSTAYTAYRAKNKTEYKEDVRELRSLFRRITELDSGRIDTPSILVISSYSPLLIHGSTFYLKQSPQDQNRYELINSRNSTTIAYIIKLRQNDNLVLLNIKPNTVFRWFLEGVPQLLGRKVITTTFSEPSPTRRIEIRGGTIEVGGSLTEELLQRWHGLAEITGIDDRVTEVEVEDDGEN